MQISVITLGTRDQRRAERFYRALLESAPRHDRSGVCYFALTGSWLALYPREALADYCGVDSQGTGFSGVTLSVNLASPAEVGAALDRAREAGARVVRDAGPTDWGGHAAWIADPDGHLWELVYNPRARP